MEKWLNGNRDYGHGGEVLPLVDGKNEEMKYHFIHGQTCNFLIVRLRAKWSFNL